MEDLPLPVSQTNSRLVLEPAVASEIARGERERRLSNQRLGLCRSRCGDIDDYVLLGGLERGSVIGLSAEREDEFGLVILAHSLLQGVVRRVLVITPKPASTILPVLRDGITAELASRDSGWKAASHSHRSTGVRDALDRVMLSCVFDMDGLWEVLADLEQQQQQQPADPPAEKQRDEIQDSEDDEDDVLGGDDVADKVEHAERETPDLIVITHFSSLLSAVFSHRASQAAHARVHQLSSRLRRLSRSLPSNPLILVLNSTNTAVDPLATTTTAAAVSAAPSSLPPPARPQKPLDPTLRSIFYNPQLSSGHHGGGGGGGGGGGQGGGPRRYTVTKPAFGLVFAQLLDLHLLCTRVPRAKRDAELLAGTHRPDATGRDVVEFVTVVEVLLDEMGVWEPGPAPGDGKATDRRRWRSREQRWGPVTVNKGRVVEAFPQPGPRVAGLGEKEDV